MDTGMTISEYAAVKELENEHRDGWGSATALWVLVAAVIIIAIVYNWTKNCNEKVAFATGLSHLSGRVDCMQPKLETLNGQMYGVAQTLAGTVVGINDIKTDVSNLGKTVYLNPVDDLTARAIAGLGHNNCNRSCGCGNREFQQTQTYNLASQGVTVTETCRN